MRGRSGAKKATAWLAALFLLAVSPWLSTAVFSAVEMPHASYLKGLTWLGHASFKLVRGGVTIYFDPWRLANEPHDADIVLVSHPHFDHLDADSVAKVAKPLDSNGNPQTVVATVADGADQLNAANIAGAIQVVKPGDTLRIKGVKIEAVPAYNTNKAFHLKESNWVGYIVEAEGARIYHAGDTDFIPEMANFKVDVALLPVSGTYVMTAEEAAQAVRAMKPKVSIPMHYGAIVGTAADAKRFQQLLSDQVVEILTPEG